MLLYRVVWVVEGVGQRIAEHFGSLLEGDTMLGKIRNSFLLIPLETHVKFSFGFPALPPAA